MKGKLNFIIDVLMFLLLAAITGLGFLMKYVLIPGKDRVAHFGRFVDLYFLGLDRHEWGGLHLILGFVLLGLLVLHIVLHWNSIQCLFRRLINGESWRGPLLFAFSAVSLFLFAFPFLIRIEIREAAAGSHVHHHASAEMNDGPARHEMPGADHSASDQPDRSDPAASALQIQGRMTLIQVSEQYHVPVASIVSGLHIDDSVSPNTQLGYLRKRYGFHMSDVIRLIEQCRNQSG